MASPQKENGYTAIANELLERFSHPGMSGSELRVVLFITRKTYGYHKVRDRISLSQFQLGTSMNRAQAVRTLKELLDKKIITKEGGFYKLNKNWEEWVVSKRSSIQKDTVASIQKDTKTSIQKDTHKRKKENITKENATATPSPFVWNEYLKKMDGHKQRHVQIIAFFFKERGITFDTLPKAQTAVRRHLRAARELQVFSDDEIIRATDKAKTEYPNMWTIETLTKILTK